MAAAKSIASLCLIAVFAANAQHDDSCCYPCYQRCLDLYKQSSLKPYRDVAVYMSTLKWNSQSADSVSYVLDSVVDDDNVELWETQKYFAAASALVLVHDQDEKCIPMTYVQYLDAMPWTLAPYPQCLPRCEAAKSILNLVSYAPELSDPDRLDMGCSLTKNMIETPWFTPCVKKPGMLLDFINTDVQQNDPECSAFWPRVATSVGGGSLSPSSPFFYFHSMDPDDHYWPIRYLYSCMSYYCCKKPREASEPKPGEKDKIWMTMDEKTNRLKTIRASSQEELAEILGLKIANPEMSEKDKNALNKRLRDDQRVLTADIERAKEMGYDLEDWEPPTAL